MIPQTFLRFVDPAELISGRVNTVFSDDRVELRIDRTKLASILFCPLSELGVDITTHLVPRIIPGRPPIVRYFMERDIPSGLLIHADVTPYQIDIYVKHGLMPPDLADEIAAHSTYLLRRLSP
ncbi:MAG: hypothetical protein JWQ95_2105 [Sphaerisporangium sp.]|nr:hypothetical protein [Sphaerisporangium sp.]